jgi:hypothetical protein
LFPNNKRATFTLCIAHEKGDESVMHRLATLSRTARAGVLAVLSMAGHTAAVAESVSPELEMAMDEYVECSENCMAGCATYGSDFNAGLGCLEECKGKCEPPALDPALYPGGSPLSMQQLVSGQQAAAQGEKFARCLSECEGCMGCGILQNLDQGPSLPCPAKCLGGTSNCLNACLFR